MHRYGIGSCRTPSLMIGGLPKASGDPLSQGGNATDCAGKDIADIVFLSLTIAAGVQSTYAGNMIVGTADSYGNVSSCYRREYPEPIARHFSWAEGGRTTS